MNTKNFIFAVMLVFSFLLLSCGKDENGSVLHDYRVDNVLYAKGSKLKRVYKCSDNDKMLYAEYKYDISDRISRVDFGSIAHSYQTYLYNEKGQLDSILSYVYYENLPALSYIVVFSYDAEGKIIKQQTITENGQGLGSYFLYQYTDGRLTKQEVVVDGQSPQYILFEYKGDKLWKSKSYFPGSDQYDITENFYDQDLVIYVSTSKFYDDSKKGWVYYEVKNYYDYNDNLIKAVVTDRWPSSSYTGYEKYNTTEYEYE